MASDNAFQDIVEHIEKAFQGDGILDMPWLRSHDLTRVQKIHIVWLVFREYIIIAGPVLVFILAVILSVYARR